MASKKSEKKPRRRETPKRKEAPDGGPEPVRMPPEALRLVQGRQADMNEAAQAFQAFTNGVRVGLGVPATWTLNVETGVFSPPAKPDEKTEGEGSEN